jgi:hypothetical protein
LAAYAVARRQRPEGKRAVIVIAKRIGEFEYDRKRISSVDESRNGDHAAFQPEQAHLVARVGVGPFEMRQRPIEAPTALV